LVRVIALVLVFQQSFENRFTIIISIIIHQGKYRNSTQAEKCKKNPETAWESITWPMISLRIVGIQHIGESRVF